MEVYDLVTLVLVKWSFSEILYLFTFLIELINRERSIDLEESRFLDETLIRCSGERELSLCCFINEIYQNATHFHSIRLAEASEDGDRIEREFTLMLRGVFLLLLTYDPRVRRFILTNHSVHRLRLKSKPPGRTKISQFMERTIPLVDRFLSLSLSLQDVSLESRSVWMSDFMLQRFQEPPYVNDIPRIDHQQIWWTRVHTDFLPSLSELDQLGF